MDVHDEFFELLLHTMISSTDDAAQARDKLIKLRDWLLNNVPSKLYRFRIYIHIMQIPVFFLRPGLAAVGIPLGPALFALLLRLLAFLALALKDGAVGLQRAVVEHHFSASCTSSLAQQSRGDKARPVSGSMPMLKFSTIVRAIRSSISAAS